ALDLAYYWSDLEPKTASWQLEDLDAGYASHTSSVSDPRIVQRNPANFRDGIRNLVRQGQLPDFHSYCKQAGLSQLQADVASEFLPNLYTRLILTGQLLPTI